jgi:hypothetical protein
MVMMDAFSHPKFMHAFVLYVLGTIFPFALKRISFCSAHLILLGVSGIKLSWLLCYLRGFFTYPFLSGATSKGFSREDAGPEAKVDESSQCLQINDMLNL